MKTYIPSPIDTQNIILPEDLNGLKEEMAKNVHEIWAQTRIQQGWSFGHLRDDTHKLHPCLVPYELLPDNEKEFDRNTAIETLKLIIKIGYTMSKR
jgi:ryanodine receptor 2